MTLSLLTILIVIKYIPLQSQKAKKINDFNFEF